MRNYIYGTILFIISSLCGFSQIVINEIQSVNNKTIPDETGDYGDWIELYNMGSENVDISGYYLTDNLNNLSKWEVPAGTQIASESYLLIWADNKNTGLHTNFKLSSSGENLALVNSSETVVHYVSFPAIPADASYGIPADGSEHHMLLSRATPLAVNDIHVVAGVANPPAFSLAGGFYNATQTITLTSDISGATIRYTLDGSEPTLSSQIYSGPIAVGASRKTTQKVDILNYSYPNYFSPGYYYGMRDFGTVIKAKVFHDNYIPSKTVGSTYFIGMRKPELPVISLSTESDNLFSEESGIYIKGNNGVTQSNTGVTANWFQDWERPAYFEYFDEEGTQQVQHKVGISTMGGVSRNWDQKSLNVKTDSEFEEGTLDYKFFKDLDIESFQSLTLRNSGNDWDNGNMARDAIIQNIVKGQMDIDYQEYQPAVLYINGEYFGLQNIRERLNTYYCAAHHKGVDEDKVEYVKTGRILNDTDELVATFGVSKGDPTHFNNLMTLLNTQSFSNAENYNRIKDEFIDIDEFINYYIAQIYAANGDWPVNNVRIWRPGTKTGKFRWILFDTDFGYGLWGGQAYSDHLTRNLSVTGDYDEDQATLPFRKLMENADFKSEFIQRFAYHINTTYNADRLVTIAQEIENVIANERDNYSDEEWARYCSPGYNTDAMISWGSERPDYVREQISDNFNNQGWATLSTSVNDTDKGYISLCSQIVPANYSGLHYRSHNIRLNAIPKDGFQFKHWEDENGNILSSQPLFLLEFQSETTVKAIFENAVPVSDLFINEFITRNNSGLRDENEETDDWIEIYNNGSETIDLAGLYISADTSKKLQFQIPFENADDTQIEPGEYKILWADSDTEQGPLHLSFKLNAEDVRIGLYQVLASGEVHTIHTIDINSTPPNISQGLFPDASENNIAFYIPTPGEQNRETTIEDATGLIINEFMTRNKTGITDEEGKTEDWIEVYNSSDEPINISGLYFTDDIDDPYKYRIPQTDSDSTIIQPGEFLILWADDDEKEGILHLGFNLNSTAGDIAIVQFNGFEPEFIDQVSYTAQYENISYGRETEGSDNFAFFSTSTPGSSNINGVIAGLNQVTFDFSIYPNPSNVYVYYHISSETIADIRVEVINALGQSIHVLIMENMANNNGVIDLTSYGKGIYIVRVSSNSTVKTQQLIVSP